MCGIGTTAHRNRVVEQANNNNRAAIFKLSMDFAIYVYCVFINLSSNLKQKEIKKKRTEIFEVELGKNKFL